MSFQAAFAIPGDLSTRTGGYIYERRLLESLPEIGQPVDYIRLEGTFPHPGMQDMEDAARALNALPAGTPLILDGLVFGSIDTGILAALDLPVVAMLHHPLGLEPGLPPARAAELIARERANLRHAAHVVVPSPHTARLLVSDFGVGAEAISIALPGFDRPPPPDGLVARAAPPLILSVGIICLRKGHDILLDALYRLRDLDWQAAIVGMTHDQRVEDKLREQRARLGLEARVRFTGSIGEGDLDRLYREADVFALATRYEGYGMVLSEALLYGLPVLSCAVGAVPETVPQDAGSLVPPDDPGAFAEALRQILCDRAVHDAMALASRRAGQSLPEWRDTARVMAKALARSRTLE